MQNRLSTPIQALCGGRLLVQYRSGKGELDVWFERRVLSVERFAWKPQIIRYTPGDWERHLINAAKVAA